MPSDPSPLRIRKSGNQIPISPQRREIPRPPILHNVLQQKPDRLPDNLLRDIRGPNHETRLPDRAGFRDQFAEVEREGVAVVVEEVDEDGRDASGGRLCVEFVEAV